MDFSTSRSKERLEDYLHAGELKLTEEDIEVIDAAGAKFKAHQMATRVVRFASVVAIAVGLGFRFGMFAQRG